MSPNIVGKITLFNPDLHHPASKSAAGLCASGYGSPCSSDTDGINTRAGGMATWSVVMVGYNRALCAAHLSETLIRMGHTKLSTRRSTRTMTLADLKVS